MTVITDTRANCIAKKLGKKNSRKCWNWAPKTRHQKHGNFVTFLCVQRVLHWIIVFDPTIRQRLAFTSFYFFFDHFDWQKLISNRENRQCQRSSNLSDGLFIAEYFESDKQRWLDAQRHRSDGLRWETERASSRKAWKKRPFSLSRSWTTVLWQTFKPQLSVQSRTRKPE